MANRALDIGVGIVEGLDSAVKNLYAINQAKQKLDMEKETHGADIKIKKAQLDKLELIYGPEQIAAEREKLKAETQAQTALFNLRSIQITNEQRKNQMAVESHSKAMLILDNVIKRGGALPPGMRINSKGDFSVAGQKAELDLQSLVFGENGGMPAESPAGNSQKEDWWNQ